MALEEGAMGCRLQSNTHTRLRVGGPGLSGFSKNGALDRNAYLDRAEWTQKEEPPWGGSRKALGQQAHWFGSGRIRKKISTGVPPAPKVLLYSTMMAMVPGFASQPGPPSLFLQAESGSEVKIREITVKTGQKSEKDPGGRAQE